MTRKMCTMSWCRAEVLNSYKGSHLHYKQMNAQCKRRLLYLKIKYKISSVFWAGVQDRPSGGINANEKTKRDYFLTLGWDYLSSCLSTGLQHFYFFHQNIWDNPSTQLSKTNNTDLVVFRHFNTEFLHIRFLIEIELIWISHVVNPGHSVLFWSQKGLFCLLKRC